MGHIAQEMRQCWDTYLILQDIIIWNTGSECWVLFSVNHWYSLQWYFETVSLRVFSRCTTLFVSWLIFSLLIFLCLTTVFVAMGVEVFGVGYDIINCCCLFNGVAIVDPTVDVVIDFGNFESIVEEMLLGCFLFFDFVLFLLFLLFLLYPGIFTMIWLKLTLVYRVSLILMSCYHLVETKTQINIRPFSFGTFFWWYSYLLPISPINQNLSVKFLNCTGQHLESFLESSSPW